MLAVSSNWPSAPIEAPSSYWRIFSGVSSEAAKSMYKIQLSSAMEPMMVSSMLRRKNCSAQHAQGAKLVCIRMYFLAETPQSWAQPSMAR